MSAQGKHMPKDAQIVLSIMKDLGIGDYEPRVLNQLLDFIYRYVTSVLDDARMLANHAKKKSIDVDDVKLAVQFTLDRSFTTPPPRDVLMEVARTKNNIPLPLIKPHCGLRLPPDRYCIAACNFKLRSNKKPQMKQPNSLFMNHGVGMMQGSKLQSKLQQQSPLSIMKRPGGNLTTTSRTQSITLPKPVIRFTSGGTSGNSNNVMSAVQSPIPANVKMEIDIDEAKESLKRKREPEDDFEGL